MIYFTRRVTINTCTYFFILCLDSYFTDLHSLEDWKWANKWQTANCTQWQFSCENVQNTEQRHFQCDNGACVNEEYVCDGVNQCCDGSDESTQTCNRSGVNIRRIRATGRHCAPPLPSPDKSITYECGDDTNPESCFINGLLRESSVAKLACNPNYLKLNDTFEESVCRKNNWLPPIDKCHKICDKLSPINVNLKCYRKSTQIDCNENLLLAGDRVKPTCKPLHTFQDHVPSYNEIICQDDGKWDKTLFKCTPVCGRSFTTATTLISNGVEERFGDSPWHVAIYNQKKVLICGGSIVHPLLILSAAHCFYTNDQNASLKSADDFEIIVSKITRNHSAIDNKYQKSYKIKEIRLSTKGYFDLANYYAADIAILILKEELKIGPTVLPACIDIIHKGVVPPDGTMGKVVGWGRNERYELKERLHTANLPFISRQKCFKLVPEDFKPYITLDKFCAGSEQGSGVLEGDSGGGLLFKEGDFYFLRGIVSIKQPEGTKLAAFTDLNDHMDWIVAVRDQMDRELINKKTTAPSKNPVVSNNEVNPIQSFDDFDWKIWKLLNNYDAENVVVSPMLIKLVISVLYVGSPEKAAKEMESVLGINSTLKETVEQKMSSIMQTLDPKEEENKLNTNIKLFADTATVINPRYSNKIKKLFNSTVGTVHFGNETDTHNEFDKWTEEIAGKIPPVYPSCYNGCFSEYKFGAGTAAMLLGVVFFKGVWKYEPIWPTEIEPFYSDSDTGRGTDVFMVSLKNKFDYYEMKEVKSHFIRIPYVGDKFAMYILYPYEIEGLETLIQNITPEIISRTLARKTEKMINLSLPLFLDFSTIELVNTLKKLGIRELFRPEVTLNKVGFSPKGPFNISSVQQRSGFEVDTLYSSTSGNQPVNSPFDNKTMKISINHPFMYLVVDEKNHNIVIIGKLINAPMLPK